MEQFILKKLLDLKKLHLPQVSVFEGRTSGGQDLNFERILQPLL